MILIIGNNNAAINAGRLVAGQRVAGRLVAEQKNGEIRVISSNAEADIVAKYIAEIASDYTHIIAPHTAFGREIMAYLSGILSLPLMSNIVEILSSESFKRPIYAGEFVETIRNIAAIKLLTISPSSFDTAQGDTSANNEIVEEIFPTGETAVKLVEARYNPSDKPSLSSAYMVVCGGIGVGSADDFGRLTEFATTNNAAIGASLGAINAGYATADMQVGQSGTIIAPDIYIGAGISGAIQHLSGIRGSKTVFAININADAPIFSASDYYYVGSWEELL